MPYSSLDIDSSASGATHEEEGVAFPGETALLVDACSVDYAEKLLVVSPEDSRTEPWQNCLLVVAPLSLEHKKIPTN